MFSFVARIKIIVHIPLALKLYTLSNICFSCCLAFEFLQFDRKFRSCRYSNDKTYVKFNTFFAWFVVQENPPKGTYANTYLYNYWHCHFRERNMTTVNRQMFDQQAYYLVNTAFLKCFCSQC